MVGHGRLFIQGRADGRSQHRQQGQGGDEDQVGHPHRPADLPADGLLFPQGGILGELGGEDQPQGAEKGRGEHEHGQGHTEGDPVGGHRLPLIHAPQHQQPGDEDGVGRGDQVPQQGGKAKGQGDVSDLPPEDGALQPLPLELAVVAQVHPEEGGLGKGGENFAQDHAQDDGTHRLFRAGGMEDHQKGQDDHSLQHLLGQFGQGGGGHPAGAVKIVLMEVLRAGEQQAGDQQDKPQLGPGVPQDVYGGPVGKDEEQGAGEDGQQEKEPHRLTPDLMDGPPVSQGLIPGGQVGDRRGEPHRGHGQQHRVDGQDELIQAQDLCPGQTGQTHPVDKSY